MTIFDLILICVIAFFLLHIANKVTNYIDIIHLKIKIKKIRKHPNFSVLTDESLSLLYSVETYLKEVAFFGMYSKMYSKYVYVEIYHKLIQIQKRLYEIQENNKKK